MRPKIYVDTWAVVYVLTDFSDNVFYVGCTILGIENRLTGHISEAKANMPYTNKLKNAKIRSLKYQVRIKEVDRMLVSGFKGYECNRKANALETKWLLHYYHEGAQLVNNADLKRALQILESEAEVLKG